MEYSCAHIIGLPYNAHTYLLGPIMGQLDLRSQLYIRNFRFLWHAFRSDNNIIYTCINNALCNSNKVAIIVDLLVASSRILRS